MPWTLWRHVTGDLLKLVLISTGVLVLVIAFAAAIKPLADGVLRPAAALGFMAFATVPMMAYALPFAAAFGAAMAYHRMAQDNEVVAALAGGVPHRVLLVPALVCGAVLAVGLGALNDRVIPTFLQRMEQMVTLDAVDMLVRQLDQGQSAELGQMIVDAESVHTVDVPADSGAVKALRLLRVTALELDASGGVLDDATAAGAWVSLWPGEQVGLDDGSLVGRMQLERASLSSEGSVSNAGVFNTPLFRVPNAFSDDPKFLTGDELEALRDEPERMGFIRPHHTRLARAIALAGVGERLDADIRETGAIRLDGSVGTLSVRASGVEGAGPWRFVPEDEAGGVEITLRRMGGDDTLRLVADEAELRAEPAEGPTGGGITSAAGPAAPGGLRFVLDLRGVRLSSAGGGVQTDRGEQSYSGLALRDGVLNELRALPSGELMARARRAVEAGGPGAAGTASIESARRTLEENIDELGREVTSKQHERMAMAAVCPVMVLLGAITALRLRHAMPLAVYLWSFFPALGAVIMIAVGQEAIHDNGASGIPVIWSGVVALGVAAAVGVVRLKRVS